MVKRIALISPLKNRRWERLPDYFLLRGWEGLLAGHATERLSAHEELSANAPHYDLALVLGSEPARANLCASFAARGIPVILASEHPRLREVEPEWFITAAALPHARPKPVFCGDETNLAVELWRKLRSEALLLPTNPQAFARLRGSGINALFAPFLPEAHLTALATASHVVALDPVSARTAQALGKTVSLNFSNGRIELPALDPAAREAKREEQRRKVAGLFGSPRPREILKPASPLHVACISDWNYLPFFLGLAANLRQVHSGAVNFSVLALDERAHAFLRHSPLLGTGKLYRLDDLYGETELCWVTRRSVAQRAFTAKPKLLATAIRAGGGPVLYSDSDLFFYASPAPWLALSGAEAVKVCRQRNASPEQDRRFGLFQAGLVAANERAAEFLAWWTRLTLYRCEDTGPRFDYFFGDQGYLDLAPVLFPEFVADTSSVHNVAPWNEQALNVTPDGQSPWRPRLGGGELAHSYHAAYADALQFGDGKTAWDQLASFFSDYPWREAKALLPAVAKMQTEFLGSLGHLFGWEEGLARRIGTPCWLATHPRAFHLLTAGPWRGPFSTLVALGERLRKKWRTFRAPQFRMGDPCSNSTQNCFTS